MSGHAMALKTTSIAILIFLLAPNLYAIDLSGQTQPPKLDNYCKEPASWEQWNALVAKCPNDLDVQTLHALRIGLCTKIEQGSITLEEAIALFDHAHRMVVERKLSEREKGKGDL